MHQTQTIILTRSRDLSRLWTTRIECVDKQVETVPILIAVHEFFIARCQQKTRPPNEHSLLHLKRRIPATLRLAVAL